MENEKKTETTEKQLKQIKMFLGDPRFIPILMIIWGIMAVIYFTMFFDTSVAIPTTEVFGQTVGGGRINNLGLMNDRTNGITIGIGVAIFGLILSIVAKSKSKE